MNTAHTAAWQERFSEACYRHILPHLENYHVEPDLEKCLPLMEPRVFAAFAVQACRDVAALVVGAAREQYSRHTSGLVAVPTALLELRVEDGDEAEVGAELAVRMADFAHALEQYAPAYGRFQQVLGQAGDAVWDNASAYGLAAGEWAGDLFGNLVGVIASAVGGYFGGKAVEQQVQAEGERLQHAFQIMLQAYDQAMDNLTHAALDMLAGHRDAVIVAVRSTRR